MKTILNITANSQIKSFDKKRWLLFLLMSMFMCHGLKAQNTEELNYFNLVLPDNSMINYELTDGISIHFQDSMIVVNGLNYYMEDIVKYYFSVDLYYSLIVAANPTEGGIVNGGGNFLSGAICTVTAVPNDGYDFWCWVEEGRAVSTEANYSFTLSGPRNLVALFRPVSANSNIIVFADPNVEMLCLEHWDTDGDEYLSYDEAAAVTNLGYVFEENTSINSFDELQYFTGLTSIGSYAFYDCSGLTSFVLPSSVTTIGNYAFSNCTSLTGDLVIPNTITTIGERAFYRCSGFNGSITIGENVINIGHYAFSECSNITTLNYNAINSNACNAYADFGWLERCYALHTLNIGEQVQVIPDNAFYGYNLNFTGTLTIPNSVTTIGENAFGNNGFTGTLTIGENVESIGNQAFYNCSSITSMYCLAETPPTLGENVFYNVNQSIPVYVLCDAIEPYENAVWGGFNNFNGICGGTITVAANPAEGGIVTGGGFYEGGQYCTVTAVANEGYVFVNWTKNGVIVSTNSEYTSLVVGDVTLVANFVQDGNIIFADANVKSICVANWDTNGDGELSYAEAASVTDLGTYFYNNSNLTSFDELQYFIGLSSISNNAFYYCRGLTSIVLPSSVTTIGNYAFYYCTSLTGELVIPETVTAIGNYAFYNCYGLTFVDLPNFMTTIGSAAFYNCYGLTSIALPGSLTTIGSSVFYYCYGLTSIVLPNSLTTIGDYAFYYCTGLTGELVIPEAVTAIGNYAFRNCNGLISIVLPNSLTTIGNYTFYNCYNLQLITSLAVIPPTIGNYTFYGSYDKQLIVPCDAVETYQNADYWSSFTNILGMCGGTVTVGVNLMEGGTVTGGGYYDSGAQCTVTAIANEGFTFANWTQNGAIVSASAEYSFYVMGDATLVANFVQDGNIIFADANVKSVCVANWDTNNDGELSYAEAASVTDLSYYFQYNSTITSFDELQYFIGLSSIGDYAFYYCSGLTSFVLPNTVTTIGDGAFGECYALTSVVLPSSLTTIEYNAFYYCTGLTGELVIPETVTTIGDYAFYNCYNLQSIASLAVIPPSIGSYTFYDLYDKSLMVPCDVVETYQNADYWSYFTNIQGLCPGTITIEANPSVGGSVTGEGYYEGGATCTLTAIANTGYTFINWKENGTIVSYDAIYSFIVRGDRDLVANFAEEGSMCNIVFDLYDSYGDGWTNNYLVIDYGNGTSEQLTVESGSFASYSRSIASGSHITLTWISGSYPEDCSFDISFENGIPIYHGSNLSSNFQYEFTLDCAAAFVQYTISAVANPEEGGAVGGVGTYDVGTTCVMTATPNSGYYFVNWTENGTEVSYDANYSFIVSGDRDLVANFAEGNMICIGDGGAATNNYLPSYNYYKYSLTQQIYTANEIGITGTINSIAFYNGGAEKTRTYDFYMKHTTKNNFSSNTDWIAVSPSDLVFSGSVTMVANDWTMIIFDTPFDYDGTSNVVLVADDNTGEYTSSPHMACRVFDADGIQAIYKYEDGTNYDPYNPSGYSGTRLSVKNQIILVMENGSSSYVISPTANPTEGGTVTGGGTYNNGSVCTLTATANPDYTFVNWTKDGEVVSTEATYSFIVTESASFVANFVIGQSVVSSFTEGWNWWSTYIEQDGIDGLSLLEEGLGTNGLVIKSQSDGYTEYYDDYDLWYGSLESINNESSYLVKTSAPCQVSMTGAAVMPSQHPITVDANGWTWIGYPVAYSMDINAALGNLSSIDGDMLKSQEGYAEFYEDYGWFGSLGTLSPSMGYMYKSNNDSPVTFTYPDNGRTAMRDNITAKDNHWMPMASAYPFNMTVTAVVELDGEELRSDRYELAAFANGESRGSVRLMYVEPIDRYVAFLTIAGEEAADLSFSLYNTETGMECFSANEVLAFEANATHGRLGEPFVVSFRGTTGMDELANSLRVYPNPVNAGECFRIGMNAECKAPVRVEIVNALGVVVSVETSIQAPASIVAPVTAGVYTLRVTVEGKGTAVRKLVVK